MDKENKKEKVKIQVVILERGHLDLWAAGMDRWY